MKNSTQPFIVFLVPFLLAITLIFVGNYIFAPDEIAVKFGFSDEYISTQKQIYYGLIFGLFILSLLLPAFIALRSEPMKRPEIKLKDI